MVKKRNSREQKIKADHRHFSYHIEESKPFSESKLSIPISNLPMPVDHSRSNTLTYPYLKKDLSKTLIVTTTILAIQIITFLVLKNHIVTVLGISY